MSNYPKIGIRPIIDGRQGGVRESLMTVSPKGVAGAPEDIFSFDATEASVAAICDMLLQSYDGAIEFCLRFLTYGKTVRLRVFAHKAPLLPT